MCNVYISPNDQLKVNPGEHLAKKSHVNNVCNEGFLQKSNLNNHMITHTFVLCL